MSRMLSLRLIHAMHALTSSQLIGECNGDKNKRRILEDLEDRH